MKEEEILKEIERIAKKLNCSKRVLLHEFLELIEKLLLSAKNLNNPD